MTPSVAFRLDADHGACTAVWPDHTEQADARAKTTDVQTRKKPIQKF